MKFNKLKKVLAVTVVSAILMQGLTGCAKKDNGGGTSETPGTTTPVESVDENFNETGLPILKEKEKFTIAVQQMSNLAKAEEKFASIMSEEETNVEIEWIEIAPSAWTEKINIMFASNDLPDAFLGPVNVGVNYPQLVVLDDLLDKYAPNMTKVFADNPELKSALVAPDGKIHSLPTEGNAPHNMVDSVTWINAEWLDNLGLNMPTTTDDFYEVLKAFKTGDPNKNGTVGDEIPYTFSGLTGWGVPMENMFGPFGVIENGTHLFSDDGKITFSAEEEGYYETLKYMNKLYAEGLIDPDVFVHSNDQYQAKIVDSNKVGVYHEWGPKDGEKSVFLPPLTGPNRDQFIGLNSMVRQEGFVITAACEKPEVLMRWFDNNNSDKETILNWTMGEKGVIWDDGPDSENSWINLPANMPEAYGNRTEWKNAISFSGQAPVWNIYGVDQMVAPGDKRDYKKEAMMEVVEKGYGLNGPAPVFKDSEDTENLSLIKTDLDTYLNKFVSDSIMNGIDDAKWEKHLEALNGLQVPRYKEIYQKYENQ